MVCVAVILVLWQGVSVKFPYAGVWVGQEKRADGHINKFTLEFTRDGKCRLTGIDNTGQYKIPCSYFMKGQEAVLTMKLSNLQIQGRIYDCLMTVSVKPQNNGETLYAEGFNYIYTDQRSGKQSVSNYKGRLALHRIQSYE